MWTSNLTPSNLALDVINPTLEEAVLPLTMNAIPVTTLSISLPFAGDLTQADIQQTPLTSTGSSEEGPVCLQPKKVEQVIQ